MPYVERGSDGRRKGLYANLQPGVAEEWQDVAEIDPPLPPTAAELTIVDQAALNAALSAQGSVVRALALVLLQEINTLRVKTGLAAYTQAQLLTALLAKIR